MGKLFVDCLKKIIGIVLSDALKNPAKQNGESEEQ